MDIGDLKRRAGIDENVVVRSGDNSKRNALIYAARGIKSEYDELMRGNSIDSNTADEMATIINELTERAKRI